MDFTNFTSIFFFFKKKEQRGKVGVFAIPVPATMAAVF